MTWPWRLVFAAALVAGATDPAEGLCRLQVTPVAFGTYNVFVTSATDSTGTISYRCGPQDNNIRITISPGSSGTFAQRTLRRVGQPTDTLTYNLYQSPPPAQIWGDGSGGTWSLFIADPVKNEWVDIPVFGSIPAEQDAGVGAYSDTVVVTLEY
jgi:spore coat protein U-like protein